MAATQYGVFTVEQAFYEGVSKDMLGRHPHRWRRVAPRVYEVIAQQGDWRRPLMAAQLSLGDDAVLSHRSGAATLRFGGTDRAVVELSVPAGRVSRGWVLHRRPPLPFAFAG